MLGGDFEHRWTQVREAIEVMKACWMNDPSEYHGKYYDYPPVRCFPKPAQRPHPPIYLGGIMFGDQWAKRVFHRIVRYGDGWLPVVHKVAQVIDGRDQLHAVAEAAGRDPKTIRITIFGAQHQWRTRQAIEQFVPLGVEQVTIWINARAADEIRRELDALAAAVL